MLLDFVSPQLIPIHNAEHQPRLVYTFGNDSLPHKCVVVLTSLLDALLTVVHDASHPFSVVRFVVALQSVHKFEAIVVHKLIDVAVA